MALSNGNARMILVGLVLNADDEGRGLAHAGILERELDYTPEVIDAALREMEACDLVQCYQVERHRYYSLRCWRDWQMLSKPAPSRFPAPPPLPASGESQGEPAFPTEMQPEEEGEAEPEQEANGRERRR